MAPSIRLGVTDRRFAIEAFEYPCSSNFEIRRSSCCFALFCFESARAIFARSARRLTFSASSRDRRRFRLKRASSFSISMRKCAFQKVRYLRINPLFIGCLRCLRERHKQFISIAVRRLSVIFPSNCELSYGNRQRPFILSVRKEIVSKPEGRCL
jgi:hypothetical protein